MTIFYKFKINADRPQIEDAREREYNGKKFISTIKYIDPIEKELIRGTCDSKNITNVLRNNIKEIKSNILSIEVEMEYTKINENIYQKISYFGN